MVKNLPANEGDTGLIPDLGGSHMSRNNGASVTQLLTLHTLEPVLHKRSSSIATRKEPPLSANRKEPVQQRRPSTDRNRKKEVDVHRCPRVGKTQSHHLSSKSHQFEG